MNLAFHTTALTASRRGFPALAEPSAFQTGQAVPPDMIPTLAPTPRSRVSALGRVDPVGKVWGDLDTTQRSMLAAHGAILLAVAYHGYARNRGSVGWGLVWSLGGFLCPTVTFGFAMTQGFAKPLPKGD